MAANKYQSGKIYKITDNGYTECYIGSTTESLAQRLARHRRMYKFRTNGGTYSIRVFHLFDTYGVDSCKIELVEEYPCANKEQLRQREGYYIQSTTCVNKRIEYTSESDKIVRKAQAKHDYWLKNKEVVSAHRNEPFVCDICQGKFTRVNRTKHMQTPKHVQACTTTAEQLPLEPRSGTPVDDQTLG